MNPRDLSRFARGPPVFDGVFLNGRGPKPSTGMGVWGPSWGDFWPIWELKKKLKNFKVFFSFEKNDVFETAIGDLAF